MCVRLTLSAPRFYFLSPFMGFIEFLRKLGGDSAPKTPDILFGERMVQMMGDFPCDVSTRTARIDSYALFYRLFDSIGSEPVVDVFNREVLHQLTSYDEYYVQAYEEGRSFFVADTLNAFYESAAYIPHSHTVPIAWNRLFASPHFDRAWFHLGRKRDARSAFVLSAQRLRFMSENERWNSVYGRDILAATQICGDAFDLWLQDYLHSEMRRIQEHR